LPDCHDLSNIMESGLAKYITTLGNSLPQDVAKAKRIEGFKKVLEKFMDDRFIKG